MFGIFIEEVLHVDDARIAHSISICFSYLIFVFILVLRVALVYGYVSSECELLNVLHLYCICMAFTLCLCCICIEYAWRLHCICLAP